MNSCPVIHQLPFLCLLLLIPVSGLADEGWPDDRRPAFDKSGRRGQVFTHVNDWKNMTATQVAPEVDRCLWRSRDSAFEDHVFMAHKMAQFGIRGFYMQDTGNSLRIDQVADAFRVAGNGRTVALFIAGRPPGWRRARQAKNREERVRARVDAWVKLLRRRKGLFKGHPNYDRVDGHPVFVLYHGPTAPDVWKEAVRIIEEKTYRCIWLKHEHFWDEERLKQWIPIMDGTTQYASGDSLWRRLGNIADAMHEHYPQKIFEANLGPKHHSDLQGQSGSDKGQFTHFFREGLRFALSLEPDSLHVTNWNDVVENSHVFASYQQWNTYLRLLREATAGFRGAEPPRRTEPELILSNKINLRVGEDLQLEVLVFPMTGEEAKLTLDLRLLNAAAEEVHRFDPRTLQCSELRAERFRVGSLKFAEELALYPVLRYTLQDEEHGPWRTRPTRLWYSQTPNDMVWMVPLEAWREKFEVDWWLTPAGVSREKATRPGGVLVADPQDRSLLQFYRGVAPATRGKDSPTHLLRNGRPTRRFWPREDRDRGGTAMAGRYCAANAAPMEWFELETFHYAQETFETLRGKLTMRQPRGVWASRPIYVVRDPGLMEEVPVRVPVQHFEGPTYQRALSESSNWLTRIPFETIETISVPRYRIPFWHYRFDRDNGGMAVDWSGYDHHGWLGTRDRNRYGAHGPMGYNFSHRFGAFTQPIRPAGDLPPDAPEFRRNDSGRGYLHFDGENDYVYFPPRTRFPYAETCEMVVRLPEPTGELQTLLSHFQSWKDEDRRNKLVVQIDGHNHLLVHAPLGKTLTKSFRSSRPLPSGQWLHVAVVNNLETVRAYVDGEPVEESIETAPYGGYQGQSCLVFGLTALVKKPFTLGSAGRRGRHWRAPFAGDLAELRLTGRALTPEEFLRSE